LMPADAFEALKREKSSTEENSEVAAEWQAA